MFLGRLLDACYINDGDPSSEEVVILPKGCNVGVDSNMMVARKTFEQILIDCRTEDPTLEAVLVTIGKTKPSNDPVWNTFLRCDAIVDRYTLLCNEQVAKRLDAMGSIEHNKADNNAFRARFGDDKEPGEIPQWKLEQTFTPPAQVTHEPAEEEAPVIIDSSTDFKPATGDVLSVGKDTAEGDSVSTDVALAGDGDIPEETSALSGIEESESADASGSEMPAVDSQEAEATAPQISTIGTVKADSEVGKDQLAQTPETTEENPTTPDYFSDFVPPPNFAIGAKRTDGDEKVDKSSEDEQLVQQSVVGVISDVTKEQEIAGTGLSVSQESSDGGLDFDQAFAVALPDEPVSIPEHSVQSVPETDNEPFADESDDTSRLSIAQYLYGDEANPVMPIIAAVLEGEAQEDTDKADKSEETSLDAGDNEKSSVIEEQSSDGEAASGDAPQERNEEHVVEIEQKDQHDGSKSADVDGEQKLKAFHSVCQIFNDLNNLFNTVGVETVCGSRNTTFDDLVCEIALTEGSTRAAQFYERFSAVEPTSDNVKNALNCVLDDCIEAVRDGDFELVNNMLQPIINLIYEEE